MIPLIYSIVKKKALSENHSERASSISFSRLSILSISPHLFSNVEVWMNVIKTPEVILSGIGTIGVIGFLFAGNSHQKKKKKIKVNSKED